MKWGWMVGFSKYNESWRRSRKLINRNLRPAVVATYRPLLQTKAHVFLTRLLANPDDFEDHFYQFVTFFLAPEAFTEHRRKLHSLTGSQILAMSYGYEVKEPNDRNVDAAKQVMHLTGKVAPPGAFIVNHLPICGCFPPLGIGRSSTLIHVSTTHP
jgi:cytochrome P450